MEGLKRFYELRYKELMLVTFVLLFLSVGVLVYNYSVTGEFFKKGISLKGGLEVSFPLSKSVDVNFLEKEISGKLNDEVSIRSVSEFGVQKSLIVEVSDSVSEKKLLDVLREYFDFGDDSYSSQMIGNKLGESFFYQMIIALFVAFFGMGFVVFLTFRSFVPSFFVIFTVATDIIETLAVLSLLDVKLSMAGIGALLMLVGYSVDTDVLLTTRVLKRKNKSVIEGVFEAMKTGFVMSFAAFGAVFVAYFLTQSEIIKQIMLILVVGTVFDILNTWIQNAGILRWYLEWKK